MTHPAFSLGPVRDGLKTRLDTVDGLRCYDIIPDGPQAPFAVVVPVEGDYLMAMRGGLVEVNFEIVLGVSATIDRAGQDLLDLYLSAGTGETKSIFDALHADRTLGGTVDDSIAQGFKDYGDLTVNDIKYMGARIPVTAYCPRR